MNIRDWLNDVVDLSKAPIEGVKQPYQQHDRLSGLCSSRRSYRPNTKEHHSQSAVGNSLAEEAPTLQELEPGFTFSSSPSLRIDNSEECFHRRPRRKTREDRYDPHARKRKRREDRVRRNEACKRARVDDSARSSHRQVPILHSRQTGNKLIADFQAGNIPSGRLTLRRSAAFTILDRGKASAPVAANGLPNLSLSETRFLGRASHAKNPRSINVVSNAKSPNKQDCLSRVGEREVESYFNSLGPGDGHPASRPKSRSEKRQDQGLGRLEDNRVPCPWSPRESTLKFSVTRAGQTNSKDDRPASANLDKTVQLIVSAVKHRSPSMRSSKAVELMKDVDQSPRAMAEELGSCNFDDFRATKSASSSPIDKALRRCASATSNRPVRHCLPKTAVQNIFGGLENPFVDAKCEDGILDAPQKRPQCMSPLNSNLSRISVSNADHGSEECLDAEATRMKLHNRNAIVHTGAPRSNLTGHRSAYPAHGRRMYNEQCHNTSVERTSCEDVGYGRREETTLDLGHEQGARALDTMLAEAHKAPVGIWRIGRKLY